MDARTRSVIVALALLAAGEVGLRLLEGAPGGELPVDRPVVILLGTSRSKAGLSPEAIERTLFVNGVFEPWVANASLEASTSVGLYETYMAQIHPLASGASGAGGAGGDGEPVVIAIEVRGSGLNDSYMSAEEEKLAERFTLVDGDLREVGFLSLLAGGRFAPASRALVSGLWIARGEETIRPRIEALWREDEPDARDDGPLAGSDVPWARGARGWLPYPDVQEPNLREGMWRAHYRGVLLKNYALGGVQTDFLRLLLRRIRADGFRAVLYNMPITDIQRGFFEPGDYDRYLRHVHEVAADEGVAFVDLDSALDVPLEAFTDTHHLRVSAVPIASRELAERALLPLFRE